MTASPPSLSRQQSCQPIVQHLSGVFNTIIYLSIRAFFRPPTQLNRGLGVSLGISTLATLLGAMLSALPASAAVELRVAIEEDVSSVQVGGSTKSLLRDGSGQVVAEIPAMGSVLAESQPGLIKIHQYQGNLFWLEPTGGGYVAISNKWYRGRTKLISVGGQLAAVNYVDLEHYLYSVVGSEMPVNWPLEALKAQAVAARSYALHKRQHTSNSVFDVGDTATWQVYKGLEGEASMTQAAVNETAGQVLTFNGQIIEAVFHSSSGGHTENVEDIWSSPRPYLRGVTDFDHHAPVFQWQEQFSAEEIRERITGVGSILSITPTEWTPRGRIVSVQVVGDQGTRVISGTDLRRSLGLRSTLFAVVPQMGRLASAGGSGSLPVTFYISGRGFGHGVGMSQWGAYGMAAQGYTYQQILGHYFQNTTLSRIQGQ